MQAIDTYRATLDPNTLAMVDALRGLAAAAGPHLTERIKWNAPSFAIGDDDRITLGLERKGGVRVVLHRGAKAKDSIGFDFPDPDNLAKWPASDRGVLTFATLAEIEGRRQALGELFTRWLERTA